MYSYVLKLVLKDGSDVVIRTKSTTGTKSIINIIDESYTELEDVDGVLYFKREKEVEINYSLDELV